MQVIWGVRMSREKNPIFFFFTLQTRLSPCSEMYCNIVETPSEAH